MVLRSPADRLSVRFTVRSASYLVVALVATAAAVIITLGSGGYEVPVHRVVAVLLGGGTHAEQLVVLEWRLPRALMAVVAGAALALSGAIFQAMTRNPLGSPDVIGFSSGAYAGAVLAILVWSGDGPSTPAAALAGGLLTALVVYALSMRRGVEGFRLIIVGIAVSQVLTSVTAWIMLQAEVAVAVAAAVWGNGTLNDVTWTHLRNVSVAVAVLLPVLAALGQSLRALALGDDMCRALGVRTSQTMLILTLVGVALTAVVTAYCGLILFIALAAPQIARRLVRSASIPLAPTAATGALLLVVSDWVAQHGLGRTLPVGVVTVSIGGLYLLYLLVREGRRR